MRATIRERLADLCHEQWSGWMKYQFSRFTENNDKMELSSIWVLRWTRQLCTPYADLTEKEKDSDRKEADRFLGAINYNLRVLLDDLAKTHEEGFIAGAKYIADHLQKGVRTSNTPVRKDPDYETTKS